MIDMELLTAIDIAKIIKASKWFVYKHYKSLGGFKIGGLIRFEKEAFFNKLKEVIENDSLQTPGVMEIRFLETRSQASEKRISHQGGSADRRSNGQKKSQRDEYGLHKALREQVERTGDS